jgi:hypothetical protein
MALRVIPYARHCVVVCGGTSGKRSACWVRYANLKKLGAEPFLGKDPILMATISRLSVRTNQVMSLRLAETRYVLLRRVNMLNRPLTREDAARLPADRGRVGE